MENNQDQVWISREEYDRLRQAQASAPIYSNNTIAMAEENKAATPITIVQVIAGVLLAFLSFAYPPAIALFAVFGIVSIFDYFRSRKLQQQRKPKKSWSILYLLLVIVPLALFVIPIVGFIGMMLFFVLICSLQGDSCRGS